MPARQASSNPPDVGVQSAQTIKARLKLQKVLGKGAFAAVYLGTYDEQPCAVKVLHPEYASPTHTQCRLLLREGQLLQRGDLPKSVARCLAICQVPNDLPGLSTAKYSGSTWALVLEYVSGGTLARRILQQMTESSQVYSNYEAFLWTIDIATALAALHSCSPPIIHRDLKQENIVLSGDLSAAKLIDFGLHVTVDNRASLLRHRSRAASVDIHRTSLPSLAAMSLSSTQSATSSTPSNIMQPLHAQLHASAGPAQPGVSCLPPAPPQRQHCLAQQQAGAAGHGPQPALSMCSSASSTMMQGITGGSGPAATTASVTAELRCQAGSAASAAALPSMAAATGHALSGLSAPKIFYLLEELPPHVSVSVGSSAPGSRQTSRRPSFTDVARGMPGSTLVPLNEEASYHGSAAACTALAKVMSGVVPPPPGVPPAPGLTAAVAAAADAQAEQLKLPLGIECDTPPRRPSQQTQSSQQQQHGVASAAGASQVPGTVISAGGSPVTPPAAHSGAQQVPGGNVPAAASSSAAASPPAQQGDGGACSSRAGLLNAVPGLNGEDVDLSLHHVFDAGAVAHPNAHTSPSRSSLSLSGHGANSGGAQLVVQQHRPSSCSGGVGVCGGSTSCQHHLQASRSFTSLMQAPLQAQQQQQQQQQGLSPCAASPSAAGGGCSVTSTGTALALPLFESVAARHSSCADQTNSKARRGQGAVEGAMQQLLMGSSPTSTSACACTSQPACLPGPTGTAGQPHSPGPQPCKSTNAHSDTQPALETSTSMSMSPPAPSSLTTHHSAHAQQAPGASATAMSGQGTPGCPQLTMQPPSHAQPPPPAAPGSVAGGSTTPLTPLSGMTSMSMTVLGGSSVGAGASAGGGGSVSACTGPSSFPGLARQSVNTVLRVQYERDFHWVFRLTGQTGSGVYMSPEVLKGEPYNEKVDVFSFGVVLYEVFARTLLLVSKIGNGPSTCATAEEYARLVAEGYRPERAKQIPEPVWALIKECWDDDPCERPSMAEVVVQLQAMQRQLAPTPQSGAGQASCASCIIS